MGYCWYFLLATLNKDLSICSNNKKDFSLALFALFDKLASSPSSLPTFAPSLKLWSICLWLCELISLKEIAFEFKRLLCFSTFFELWLAPLTALWVFSINWLIYPQAKAISSWPLTEIRAFKLPLPWANSLAWLKALKQAFQQQL